MIVTGTGGGAVLGLVRLVGVGEAAPWDGVGTPTLGDVEGVVEGGDTVAGELVTSADGLGFSDSGGRPQATDASTQAVKTASHARLFKP